MRNNSIDLWFEDLAASDAEYRHYWRLLDDDEQIKAMRFIQGEHQRRYVVSHGKLRTVLARYTGIAPETLCFAQQALGKPYLIVDGKPHGLNFNLSHSGNKMLVAVSLHYPVGVDIEIWNDRIDRAAIAEDCFADSERAYWQALPDTEKDAAFYRFWTRKESFVKAVGAGITLGVAGVVTSVDGTARFLSIPADCGSADEWRLHDLALGQGLSGALVVKTNGFTRINIVQSRV